MTPTQNLNRRLARGIRVLAPLAVLICGSFVATATQSAAASTGRTMTNSAIETKSLRHATENSTNWAGYAVTPLEATTSPPPTTPPASTTFTSVSGNWVQPKVSCTKSKATYAAFWVGLGGFSPTSQALEQIGTEATCTTAGKAKYSMWYELVPAASVPIRFKVFPGNAMTASVKVSGTQVTLQIRNLTRKTNFTKTLFMAEPDLSSAEWIAEAPTGCNASRCVQLPLAKFGTLTFTKASATTSDGHTGTISDVSWSPTVIDLADIASGPVATETSGALPSSLSTNGASFAVVWQQVISTAAVSR
ncbi:MAG: G1 family endopeptidase [Actinomycetota bacterium]|nr:G1 family endopeptidase [Actinomycetota bacterium]